MFLTPLKTRIPLFFGQATRHHVSRVVVAGLLLFAAWGKWDTLATDSVPGDQVWETRPFLVSLVVAELGFGIWLLLGLYPKASWVVAMGLFLEFTLFSGFLYLRGESSCPCLGKLNAHPGLIAGFDFLVLLTLAFCPPPNSLQVSFRTAPWRLYLFGLMFAVLAIPACLEMVYYSHQGLALDLRSDTRLRGNVKLKVSRVSSEEILAILHKSTGLDFTLDERLLREPPDYGMWNMGSVWSVMLGMSEKQTTPVRWEKAAHGYHLVPASPWGPRRFVPWAVSSAIIAAGFIGLALFTWRNGMTALFQGFGLVRARQVC